MAKARRDLPPAPLYERDYYSWALEQAALLRERRIAELDFDNLAEEVEDLGRSLADQLESRYELPTGCADPQGMKPVAA